MIRASRLGDLDRTGRGSAGGLEGGGRGGEVTAPVLHRPPLGTARARSAPVSTGSARSSRANAPPRGRRDGRPRTRGSSSRQRRAPARRQPRRVDTPDRRASAARSRRPSSRSANPVDPQQLGHVRFSSGSFVDVAPPARAPGGICVNVVAQITRAHRGEIAHGARRYPYEFVPAAAKIPAQPGAHGHNEPMPEDDLPPPRPSALVVEHPAPLNTLTEIFGRLNIAVGIDSSGQVVLARPDSLLAGVTNKDERDRPWRCYGREVRQGSSRRDPRAGRPSDRAVRDGAVEGRRARVRER